MSFCLHQINRCIFLLKNDQSYINSLSIYVMLLEINQNSYSLSNYFIF